MSFLSLASRAKRTVTSPPGLIRVTTPSPSEPCRTESPVCSDGIKSMLSCLDLRFRIQIPSLQTGDSVRHGSLGEGVVTRIEPGGLVTVRFARDASERKLMLEYAPLEKLG